MSYFDLDKSGYFLELILVIGSGFGILFIYDLWLYTVYDFCHPNFFQLGTDQFSASIFTVTAFLPGDLVIIIISIVAR